MSAFESGQLEILEHIASGAPLAAVLEEIVVLIERLDERMISSILILEDRSVLRHGAAPRLPIVYRDAIDGAQIGPDVGSCGTAAFRAERVIVEDIATDPLWARYKDFALPHDLRSCWSSPIFSANKEVLGTFAIYYRTPRGPSVQEIAWVDRATHLAAIAIMRDRAETALRSSDAALRRSEAELRIIFENANVIFYVRVEPPPAGEAGPTRFRFVSANPAFLEVTGFTEEQVVGHLLDETLPAASRDEVAAYFVQAIEERRTVSWTGAAAYPAGKRYGEVTVTPIFDDEGACTNLVGTVHDFTERKALEVQVARAERMKSLGTLAGGIAHDFNNLLMAIVGSTALAKRGIPSDHPSVRALGEIDVATSRAAALVRQILTFARMDPPKRQRVALASIAEEVVRLVRATVPASITISTAYDDDLPEVLADPTQVHQVIMNLATNAAHAMEPDGGTISLRLERAAPGVRVVIEDQGAGIERASLHRIFEPFFTTKGVGRGTGLGLSVVHGIVKNHGGSIDVDSEAGRGTKFSVHFPESGHSESET